MATTVLNYVYYYRPRPYLCCCARRFIACVCMPQSQTQLPFSFVASLSIACLPIRSLHSPFIACSFALHRSFQWWSEYFYLISSKKIPRKIKTPQTITMHAPHSNAIFISKNNVLDITFHIYHPAAPHCSTCTLTKRILWIFDLFNCNISQDRSYFCTFHGITGQNIKMCRFDLT